MSNEATSSEPKPSNESTSSKPKPSKLFTVRSSDNEEFELPESGAVLSETIKHLVEDGVTGDGNNPIPVAEVDAKTLAKVVECLKKHGDEGFSNDDERKKFDDEFLSNMELNELPDLVMAANYLAVKALLDMICQKIADNIANKSVSFVREFFGFENDYMKREEDAIKKEFPWAFENAEE